MSTNPGQDVSDQGATNPQITIAEAAGPATTPLKKTISCTQCRRRKLKCDRVKPCCGTCSRLQHQCVYPEGRVKSTTKRRNVKDLEARLAQVENLLNFGGSSNTTADSSSAAPVDPDLFPATDADWDAFEMELGLEDDAHGITDSAAAIPLLPPLLVDEPFSNELIGFGMQEQLPSVEIINELHDIYFSKVHNATPILNKYRYLAQVNLPYPLGPPLCLRYMIWALAAAITDRYSPNPHEVFYRRSRKYAELDEMKGQGEQFITIAHAQCWALLANYEAQNMYLSRAWISSGKSVRLVQMMNLHRLDSGEDLKQIIHPARDWTELEERRRAFWAAFTCDRYSCAGTGWPLSIDERDVTTRLPCSEEAYELCRNEEGLTLTEAMTAEGASKISPYAGLILMACLFGHNWLHENRPGPNDSPGDLHGEFWKRHRRMDKALLNIAMFLPQHLKLPAGYRDPNIVNLHLNLQSSQICLHEAAIRKVEKHKLDPQIRIRSAIRTRAAAEEVVNIVQTINQFEMAEMNPWMSFNLYVATGVLIEGCTSPDSREQSLAKLEILLNAMQTVGRKHNVTHSFMQQLKIDLDNAGIHSNFETPEQKASKIPNWGGPKSIWHRTSSRIDELNADVTTPSLWTRGGPSPMSGGTMSSNDSTNSATPPTQFEMGQGMNGFYHRVNFDLRLRRPHVSDDSSNSGGGQGPSSREMSDPLVGGLGNSYSKSNVFTRQNENEVGLDNGRKVNQADAILADPELPTPEPSFGVDNNPPMISLGHRQQWFTTSKTEEPKNVDMSNFGAVTDNIPPGWASDQFDPVNPTNFSEIDFDPADGDINSLLNNASWDNSMFNRM